MESVTLDIADIPTTGKQWDTLHPMARARLKSEAFVVVWEAVLQAKVERIETPCVVDAHIYFVKGSQGGGKDFDNLAICIGKMYLDPLCPEKIVTTRTGVRHRRGLGLIPDDTVDHIRGIMITRHPESDRNHTVLVFQPPGERLKVKMREATEKTRQRHARRAEERKVASDKGTGNRPQGNVG